MKTLSIDTHESIDECAGYGKNNRIGEEEPAPREEDLSGSYWAYVLDPDGNKLALVKVNFDYKP